MNDHPLSRPLERLHELCWNHARDAMFVTDCQSGIIVDINPEVERLTGYSRREVIGKPESLLHPEAERERLQDAFRKGITQPGSLRGFHLLRKDGQNVPITTSMSGRFNADDRVLILGISHDISALQEHEDRLEFQRCAFEASIAGALTLVRGCSSESMMQEICKAITHKSTFALAWIGLVKNDSHQIEISGAAGSALRYMNGLTLNSSADVPLGRGPAGVAIRTNEAQIVDDTETAENFNPWRERARQEGIRSLVAIPFCLNGDCALLSVYSAKPQAFEGGVRDAFVQLAEQIGFGLHALSQKKSLTTERRQREETQQQLADTLLTIVDALTRTMELRDSYTADHEIRVAEIACAIAREMRWSEYKILGLRLAAMVHDIGKISVPIEILNKPGPLSEPEWLLIKAHPETGYEILKNIPFTWPVAATVRQHHERLDGSGYPLGLKGDAILPEAKVLAVADMVDAMSSDRPYRSSLGIGAAILQIEREASTLLDADAVRTFIALIRNRRLIVPSY